MPRIPLIEDLTKGPIPAGSYLMVQFSGSSQWYNVSLNLAADWLESGGRVFYVALAQAPEKIRSRLNRLGVKVEEFERAGGLKVMDGYSASLGQKSSEKLSVDSMKVSDLSILFSRGVMIGRPMPGTEVQGPEWLRIIDNSSTVARFNEEKTWTEFVLTRNVPTAALTGASFIAGFAKGVHSDRVYQQLEAVADGIIDVVLEESGEETRDLIRIRTMRNVRFDSRWHALRIGENFEITLEK
jgi:KaiC/GvpD/RAD55 family RecA-like ATPase